MVTVPFVFSVNYYEFEFKDSQGNYVSNVQARGFLCTDYNDNSKCQEPFIGELWNGNLKSSTFDGTVYDITLPVLTKNEVLNNVEGYVILFYNFEYLPGGKILTPAIQLPGTYTNPIYSSTNSIITLTKFSSCSAPVTLTVKNDLYEDEVLVIRSGASMSNQVVSAFGFQSDVYNGWIKGSNVEQYYEIETTLRTRIWKYNGGVIGTKVYDEVEVPRVFYDETEEVTFSNWDPQDPGVYLVRTTSTVTDGKCVASSTLTAEQTVTVWEHYPKNQCYSMAQDMGVLTSNPVEYDPLTIQFKKLTNYAYDYDPWETERTLTPQASRATLDITGPEQKTEII